MYDNLTLYYLNQMGVFPWINRDKPISISSDVQYKAAKLLVFVPSQLSPGSSQLMKHILTYLDLGESRVKVVTHESTENSILENECRINPLLGVLCFVPEMNVLSALGQNDTPCLTTIELDALISNPKEKKQAFVDLARFKASLLNASNANAA